VVVEHHARPLIPASLPEFVETPDFAGELGGWPVAQSCAGTRGGVGKKIKNISKINRFGGPQLHQTIRPEQIKSLI
jgi:hypothetical protein